MPKIALALIAAMLALAGCNTLQGAGQDISTAGDALSEEAAETEQEM
jgi:predicted small secreted protein